MKDRLRNGGEEKERMKIGDRDNNRQNGKAGRTVWVLSVMTMAVIVEEC